MPKTRVNCPNCRQPIVADIQQLFDVGEDPSAKSQLLSGLFNIAQCPYCGYQGNLSTPIVYHDPQKELLLTYVPPDLGLPRDEQERLLGAMINQAVNRLTPEQRKGYLLRPQAHLTMQSLIERILEADGITRDMIQAQQDRVNLLQRLSSAKDEEVLGSIIEQEDQLIDSDLFSILGRLLESASVSGDRESAEKLQAIQTTLLERSTFGQQIKRQAEEVEAAVKSLQEAGRDLTREKLLDLVIQAPNETRLSALVSLTRPGLDYTFFQMLSERIEKASGEEKEKLTKLREQILEMTSQIDAQMQAREKQARQTLNQMLQEKDIQTAALQKLDVIDDFFVEILTDELETSRKSGDLERSAKLEQIANVVQQASAPPEIQFIQEILEEESEEDRRRILEDNQDKITPDFFQYLQGLISQMQNANQDPALIDRLKSINRQALRLSMQANLRNS